MSKHPAALSEDRPPRSRRLRNAAAVCIGLMIAPLIYESALICVARWEGMSGLYTPPRTPVIDWVGSCWGECATWTRLKAGVWFQDPAWKAGPTITLALAWALVAAWLLRGRRH